MARISYCKKCGRRIVWVESGTSGKKFPLDPDPKVPRTKSGMICMEGLFAVLNGLAYPVNPFSYATKGYVYFRAHRRTCPEELLRWACGGYSPPH